MCSGKPESSGDLLYCNIYFIVVVWNLYPDHQFWNLYPELGDIHNISKIRLHRLPTSVGSSKKQENSRKTSTSALLTMPKPLTVWITTNSGKFFKRSDHLICLLRNLYAGQEATVRTGHGTTDWFQIGKGVHQGCILSPCLFNLYAEYII